jgi:hypothetical protein
MSTPDRRQASRYEMKVRVEVFRDERPIADLTTRNLSETGLFLFYPKGAPLGDFLSLRLSLGEIGRLTVMGEVVHAIPGLGMGIRFFDVDEKSRGVLVQFLEDSGAAQASE